jgi:hypothetical protein
LREEFGEGGQVKANSTGEGNSVGGDDDALAAE